MAGIAEKVLLDIAHKIGDDPKLIDLAIILGYSKTQASAYKATNYTGGQVGCHGTTNLLFDWQNKTRLKHQKRELSSALAGCGFDAIVDHYHLTGGEGKAKGKSKTSSKRRAPTTKKIKKKGKRQKRSKCHNEDDSSEDNSSEEYSDSSFSDSDSSTLHGAEGQSSPSLTSNDEWKKSDVKRANPRIDDLDPKMKYVMWESLVKGNALIIGNAEFPQQEKLEEAPRPWADMDISNMKTLLRRLGYDFRNDRNIYRNLSKRGMLKAVRRFTEELNQDNPQSAVVYISSHGSEKGIQGRDRTILPIPVLLQQFSGVLLGKPKVLIIDACWGSRDTSRLPVSVRNDSTAAPPIIDLPENADIFMIHSTSYGKASWSCTENGSWFVNELCKVIYNNDRDLEDLDTIMLRVTKGMHTLEAYEDGKTSNGTQSTTVFKQGVDRKLFFFPGFSK